LFAGALFSAKYQAFSYDPIEACNSCCFTRISARSLSNPWLLMTQRKLRSLRWIEIAPMVTKRGSRHIRKVEMRFQKAFQLVSALR
jgi:hypothetical protein